MYNDENTQKEDPEDFFWQTYLDASKAEDEARPKNWEGSTTGILTFTGLFAATVAAFIVESYKLLSPDSGDRTNVLLEHLITAMANASSQNPVAAPPPDIFSASPSSIVTNVFWFSSLLIALICALLSTLVQEWSRNYVQDINRRKVLHESLRERAFNHIYIRMGVNRYGMDQFVSWIVALVHLSVFLFSCGLLVFLFPINKIVADVSTAVLGSFIIIYCVASLIPLLDTSCPYRTPISYMMAFIWILLKLRPRFGLSKITRSFQRLITRQYTEVMYRSFLTDPRFQFAWERTYVHVSGDKLGMFFKGLPTIVRRLENQEVILSHMCAFKTVYSLPDRLLAAMDMNPPSSIDPELFELIAFLSERMYALEVEHYGEHIEHSVLTSPGILHVIGSVSVIAGVAGPSQLSALLCLARVRWSLLELCWTALEKKMPVLTETEPMYVVCNPRRDFWFVNRHPNAILLLLTTGLYRAYNWEHTGASTLHPLHDDDCCRNWRNALTPEDLIHIAACNVLTAIVHVLESTENQRNHSNSLLNRTVGCFSVYNWDCAFRLPLNDKQKIPSSDFVSVLRSAGLDEWLEPGSTFDTEPRNGPNYDFLNRFPGSRCIGILRELARHVDFEAYFDRARLRNSDALTRTSILPYNVADPSTHAPAISSQPGSSRAMVDGSQRSPDGRDALLTVAQTPLENPPSPPSQNDPPAPEDSSAVEILYEDVRGTSREGVLTDAMGESLSSSSNAAVSIPPAPNKREHSRALGSDVHEVKTLDVEGDGRSRRSSEQDQANDTATARAAAAAEAQHDERAANAVEEVAVTSTALGVDEREQQPDDLPESPGLRSVRVDDDRRSREGIVQDGVQMADIARIRGSSSADVAESEREQAA